MRWLAGFLLCLLAIAARSQIAPNGEPRQEASALEQRYSDELKAIVAEITEYQFPYHFYLTSRVGVDERRVRHKQESSVHFASFRGEVVLAITGNYYAA